MCIYIFLKNLTNTTKELSPFGCSTVQDTIHEEFYNELGRVLTRLFVPVSRTNDHQVFPK